MVNVTIKQIRAFVAAVNHGNLTRAAEAMAISQSAFTRVIQDLESELAVTLFHRSNRGIELSSEGEEFLVSARRLLDYYMLAVDGVGARRAGSSGNLQFAISTAMAGVIVPQLVTEFQKDFPRISVKVQEGSSSEVREAVLNGRADVGVGSLVDIPNGLLATPILRAPLGVLAPAEFLDHPPILSLGDLAQLDLRLLKHAENDSLCGLIASQLPELENYLDPTLVVSNLTTVMTLIHASVAGAVVSGIAASHPWARDLAFLPLPSNCAREVFVFTRKEAEQLPWHVSFVSTLRRVIVTAAWHRSVEVTL